ncbi:hypothetical protein QFZ55_007921 [Streptomyces luteogriseus]|nr:hypothetical protein [Streptomyces luteogriseus]
MNPRPHGLTWPALSAHQEKKWSRLPSVGIAPRALERAPT